MPLVRLGQGDFTRDIYPEDLAMPARTSQHDEQLDLRFLTREPADVYHAKASGYLSSHWLAEFRRCPLLYRCKRMGLITRRESTVFLVGRAAHTLILEGRERYEAEFAVGWPINPKTGKPYESGTKVFAEWAERIVRTTERPAHVAKNRLSLPDEIPLDYRVFGAFLRGENPLQAEADAPTETTEPTAEPQTPTPQEQEPDPWPI